MRYFDYVELQILVLCKVKKMALKNVFINSQITKNI